MSSRCDCCDFPVEMCGKAAAEKQDAEIRKQRQELLAKGWFIARFPGTCGNCNERFTAEQDFIHAMPGGTHGYKKSKYIGECCAHLGRVNV